MNNIDLLTRDLLAMLLVGFLVPRTSYRVPGFQP